MGNRFRAARCPKSPSRNDKPLTRLRRAPSEGTSFHSLLLNTCTFAVMASVLHFEHPSRSKVMSAFCKSSFRSRGAHANRLCTVSRSPRLKRSITLSVSSKVSSLVRLVLSLRKYNSQSPHSAMPLIKRNVAAPPTKKPAIRPRRFRRRKFHPISGKQSMLRKRAKLERRECARTE